MTRWAAFTLIAVTGAASAQPPPPDPLAGVWRIETGRFYGDCRIDGAMTISPTSARTAFACRFTTRQSCPGERDATSEQTCLVSRAGDRITITSHLIRTNAPGYVPDHWRLRYESATRMSGHLLVDRPPRNRSGQPGQIATATFTRKQTPIS